VHAFALSGLKTANLINFETDGAPVCPSQLGPNFACHSKLHDVCLNVKFYLASENHKVYCLINWHFVMSLTGSVQRKLNVVAQLQTFPYQMVSTIVSS